MTFMEDELGCLTMTITDGNQQANKLAQGCLAWPELGTPQPKIVETFQAIAMF